MSMMMRITIVTYLVESNFVEYSELGKNAHDDEDNNEAQHSSQDYVKILQSLENKMNLLNVTVTKESSINNNTDKDHVWKIAELGLRYFFNVATSDNATT